MDWLGHITRAPVPKSIERFDKDPGQIIFQNACPVLMGVSSRVFYCQTVCSIVVGLRRFGVSICVGV